MATKIFAVGMALILIRSLTQADYALYVSFSAVGTLLLVLVGTGVNRAVVRFSVEHLSSTGEKPYTLYILALLIQIAVFLFLILCALIFPNQTAALVLGKTELTFLLPISILYGLGNVLLLCGQSILQVEEHFDTHVATLWIRQGSFFIIVVGLWLLGSLNFQRVAWYLTIAQLTIGIGVIIYSVGSIGEINWTRRLKREESLVRHFLSASGWLIGYYVALAGFVRMDVLMLSRFATAAELAVYGVAFQYYSLALLLLGSITIVLNPKFSRAEMQDPIRQRKFLGEWIRFTVWIGVPVILFIVFGKPFFIFLNGIQYERSFSILSILSVGVWLSLMLSPLTNIIMSRKEFRFLFLLGANAFLVSLGLFYVGVRSWGGIGAAVTVVLTHNVILQIPVLLKAYYGSK